ncbi:two component transcriptional regulator [Calothrix sp. NIES-2100]|uniref:response regulator transcription factor n=1 Tax=Calothrix sp. NIES-2100 TaxID=1954172 RepID=UPI000B5FFC7E|nr:two component transcriptional regulator [Calothrix sp. NIES-2100]
MKACQVEQSEEVTNFTLFPLQSCAIQEIKENWVGAAVVSPETVMIRAISSKQRKQILDHPLTQRELCILKMIVDGNNNPEIAKKLYINIGTVKAHIRHIFYKLNVSERAQACVLALRSGLVD